MKKLLVVAVALATAFFTGCQTRITATKNAEQVVPIQQVVTVQGKEQVITTNAIRASGGWEATARSPLWATESLSGLNIGVSTNGTVSMSIDAYNRDLSTNAVAVVNSLTEMTSDIAGKAVAGIVAYYGGGAATATSKLGSLTLSDIVGKATVKAKALRAAGAKTTDDTAKAAAEICEECCVDGNCNPEAEVK